MKIEEIKSVCGERLIGRVMSSDDKLVILNTYGEVEAFHNKTDDTYEAIMVGHPELFGVGHTMEIAVEMMYHHLTRYMLLECNLLLA